MQMSPEILSTRHVYNLSGHTSLIILKNHEVHLNLFSSNSVRGPRLDKFLNLGMKQGRNQQFDSQWKDYTRRFAQFKKITLLNPYPHPISLSPDPGLYAGLKICTNPSTVSSITQLFEASERMLDEDVWKMIQPDYPLNPCMACAASAASATSLQAQPSWWQKQACDGFV